MKLMRMFCALSLLALIATTPMCTNADEHLGPRLPMLGNFSQSAKLTRAGDTAASAGKFSEAIADYRLAISICAFYDDAQIGLARCAAKTGDYDTSIKNYGDVIGRHTHDENIDELTEYILVLSHFGRDKDAIAYYNDVVDMCKTQQCIRRMELTPPKFHPDGSDYDLEELQAMTHLMRAMNSDSQSDNRAFFEIDQALALAPNYAIVYFYDGLLLHNTHKSDSAIAFQKARSLEDSSNAAIINSWCAISK